MRQVILVLLITIIQGTVCAFVLAQSTEPNEALHLLMRAYQNGGFNPLLLQSGVAEFERNQRVEVDLKLRESMRQVAEQRLKEQFVNDEKKLAEIQENFAASKEVANNNDKQSKVRILFLGNDRSYDGNPGEHYKRLYDVSDYLPRADQWVRNTSLAYGSFVTRPNDPPDSRLWIEWIPNRQILWLRRQDRAEGEFQLWGRFQEEPFAIAALIRQKIDRQTFTFLPDSKEYLVAEIMSQGLSLSITDEINYEADAKAKVVEVKKGDKLLEIHHIDVERGYLCPYQFVTDESGNFVSERTASDFIKEKNTGLFYPQKYQERDETKNVVVTVSKYTLVPGSLRLNQRVSEQEFAIDVPAFSQVKDSRGTVVDYVAMKDGTISLAKGGYDLPNLPWLVKKEDFINYVPSRGGAGGWVRWLLMSIGIALILIALYYEWKKRVSQ